MKSISCVQPITSCSNRKESNVEHTCPLSSQRPAILDHLPFALTGIVGHVVAQHLFARVLWNSQESSWNREHLVGCFLHNCWSSLAPLQQLRKVQTSSSVTTPYKDKFELLWWHKTALTIRSECGLGRRQTLFANLFFENEGYVNLEVKLISQRFPFLSKLSSKTISCLISSWSWVPHVQIWMVVFLSCAGYSGYTFHYLLKVIRWMKNEASYLCRSSTLNNSRLDLWIIH